MPQETVVLGRINGVFGVKGWIKIFSYTRPKENILQYACWSVAGKELSIEDAKPHGKGLIAKPAGCGNRDQAAALVGLDISVPRAQLPAAEEGEYYWADLYGLRVLTKEDADLGCVAYLIETGANDVLVVQGERERLLPLVFDEVVLEINFARGFMRVDWDPEF